MTLVSTFTPAFVSTSAVKIWYTLVFCDPHRRCGFARNRKAFRMAAADGFSTSVAPATVTSMLSNEHRGQQNSPKTFHGFSPFVCRFQFVGKRFSGITVEVRLSGGLPRRIACYAFFIPPPVVFSPMFIQGLSPAYTD
ncbi:MAG: hypothetical protein ACLTXW_07010 [Christensenellales bacterium]